MNKRLTKEYVLDINENLIVTMGTMNRLNPKVIYVNCRTWLNSPSCENPKLVHNLLYDFQKEIKKIAFNSNELECNSICQVDFTSLPLIPTKKSLLELEFYVVQKQPLKTLQDMKSIVISTFQQTLTNMCDKLTENTFQLSKEN